MTPADLQQAPKILPTWESQEKPQLSTYQLNMESEIFARPLPNGRGFVTEPRAQASLNGPSDHRM
jgi:hypothetical protein